MSDIVILKLVTGQEIIAKVAVDQHGAVVAQHPCEVRRVEVDGQVTAQFQPFAHFYEGQSIGIEQQAIVYSAVPTEGFAQAYIAKFFAEDAPQIVVPEEKKIILA